MAGLKIRAIMLKQACLNSPIYKETGYFAFFLSSRILAYSLLAKMKSFSI